MRSANLFVPFPRLLREKEVIEILGISRSTLWDGVKHGVIPPPLKITRKRIAWRADSVAEHLERLTAEAVAKQKQQLTAK